VLIGVLHKLEILGNGIDDGFALFRAQTVWLLRAKIKLCGKGWRAEQRCCCQKAAQYCVLVVDRFH
jgi:hypothetical protein